ncbi:LysR family transcriptional regulator [Ideonella sp. BN130291]|uniref:LysR family transcriptional regulator n=1 Tax=Ideonella sp. BN130291 TaxID=3112940 RepID=UPI002E26C40B|nr:LysR family transcriptional regulator [Ideonella sp. BN130291]
MTRIFDDTSLGSLELFCLTAELKSFSGAAVAAGVTPAAVSRTVARLEKKLGARLLVRTTRAVRLSEEGRHYYDSCRQALGQLAEAERALHGDASDPSGTVRMSLPTSYGHHRVFPVLAEFRQRYPRVALELQVTNRNVDFASEGFDLAIRGRAPPDSGLVARKLEDAPLVVVASPSYLRRKGTPRSIDDLQGHDCIHFALPSTGQTVPWLFKVGSDTVERTFPGSMLCQEDILALGSLALGGAGLVQTYQFIVDSDIRAGRLKPVLRRFEGASRPFSLLYPANRFLPQRVRVLVDFLVRRLAA